MGPAGQTTSLVLVIGIAVAVTSIPVISRIFHDLKYHAHALCASGSGVRGHEDIALGGIGMATLWRDQAVLPKSEIFHHVTATLIYFAAGLTIVPPCLCVEPGPLECAGQGFANRYLITVLLHSVRSRPCSM